MPEDPNTQPDINGANSTPQSSNRPIMGSGGRKVIAPSTSFVQEMQAEQKAAQPKPKSVQPQAAPTATQTPAPQPLYPTPTVAQRGETPMGLSASQMEAVEKPKRKRWSVKPKGVVKLVIVLAVLTIGFAGYKNFTGYHTRTVQADGFRYSVSINRSATESQIQSTHYLLGKDKKGQAMYVSVTKTIHAESKKDCTAHTTQTERVVSKPEIDGKQHNLCRAESLNLYAMNFTHGKTWYTMAIFPKYRTQVLDEASVKTVAASVKVTD